MVAANDTTDGTTFDLVVRNGVVVDGTGLPRRRADVAVKDGRIVAVGFVEGSGTREIDAAGRVVAPGIVDPHTHYDPQLTFEPYGTSSCFHGVTTVVAGNCGFSVAPLRAGDAPWLIQMFARVEGMDAVRARRASPSTASSRSPSSSPTSRAASASTPPSTWATAPSGAT